MRPASGSILEKWNGMETERDWAEEVFNWAIQLDGQTPEPSVAWALMTGLTDNFLRIAGWLQKGTLGWWGPQSMGVCTSNTFCQVEVVKRQHHQANILSSGKQVKTTIQAHFRMKLEYHELLKTRAPVQDITQSKGVESPTINWVCWCPLSQSIFNLFGAKMTKQFQPKRRE